VRTIVLIHWLKHSYSDWI